MVYDCFQFFNEVDLVQLRLAYLNPIVDRFVIVEASETHSGLPKPLLFEENISKFSEWKDKIIYLPMDFPAFPMKPMERDFYQRSYLSAGLCDCVDGDLVIVSDLDEIPTREAVIQAIDNLKEGVVACQQKIYYFFLNRLDISREWIGTAFVPFKTIRENSLTVDSIRQIVRWGLRRDLFKGVIPNAGWHFSWLGKPEDIKYKLESYAHQEDNTKERSIDFIKGVISSDKDLLRVGVKHIISPVDSSFPDVIVDNIQKYRDLGWIQDEDIICDLSQ